MTFDSTLYKKYNIPGPRYTSYPTVPYWDPQTDVASLTTAWAKSLAANPTSSFALYLHIPFCLSLCTYCGCNTRITRNKSVAKPYLETILKEWELVRPHLGPEARVLEEFHIGGGTPTFLTPDELEFVISGLTKGLKTSPDTEFSIEADPRTTTREQLERLSRLGFRRLSLGIQDFDPKVQDTVNRVQTVEQVRDIVLTARALGFTSINFDLIYGLPHQTLQSIESTLSAVRDLRPDRIAFYSYAHVPWIKPGQRRFTEDDLPSADAKRALYERGRALLEDTGYSEIGMDHFALQTDALWKASRTGSLHRNFMGYIPKRVSPLIGLGVSAIGDTGEVFAQNEKHLEGYVRRVESGELPFARGHVLTGEDRILRDHILNLMTRLETRWEGNTFTPFLTTVPERLGEFIKDGLLQFEPGPGSAGWLRVTEAGRPFLRNICMALDARLTAQAPSTRLFSQTV